MLNDMIRPYRDKYPVLAPSARLAENATAVGDVVLEEEASLWYGAVLRGDEGSIRIGRGSNVQDNAVVHADPGYPTVVGADVTVGHGAILHGCTVGEGALIGMGAILLNGCTIGEGCLVAAGALVTQGAAFPAGHLIMGSPAKAVRPLTQEERAGLLHSAEEYRSLSAEQLSPADSIQSGGNV